jgi:hypothetical protein
MEKINKCNVQYICWGLLATCKYALKVGEENKCHYFVEGCCTNPEAQKEAVSEN